MELISEVNKVRELVRETCKQDDNLYGGSVDGHAL